MSRPISFSHDIYLLKKLGHLSHTWALAKGTSVVPPNRFHHPLFFSQKNWQLDRIRGLIKFKCNGGVRVVEGEKTSWRELCAFYGFCVWLFSREVLTVVSGFGCCQSDPTTVKFPSSFHLRLLAPVTAAAQIDWAPVMATAQINCFSIRSCKMATFYFIISFEFIS